jgi:hypothetical protein
MADDTSAPNEGGFGQGLMKVLGAIGYGLGSMVGEVRASRERKERKLAELGMQRPDLLEIPEIGKAVEKGLGLSKEGFAAYKAHAHVGGLAQTLAQTLGIPTTETQAKQPPAGKSVPLSSVSTSTPGGAQATAQVPTEQVARPSADVLQDVEKALPASGGTVSVGGVKGQPKQTISRKPPASTVSGYQRLLNERDEKIRAGDYRGAAETSDRIKALNYTPGQRTLETETAKLDPALIKAKLSVEQQKHLQEQAPPSELKGLRTKDGKNIPPGLYTREQVTAKILAGEFVAAEGWDQWAGGLLKSGVEAFIGHPLGGGAQPAEAAPAPVDVDKLLKSRGY